MAGITITIPYALIAAGGGVLLILLVFFAGLGVMTYINFKDGIGF